MILQNRLKRFLLLIALVFVMEITSFNVSAMFSFRDDVVEGKLLNNKLTFEQIMIIDDMYKFFKQDKENGVIKENEIWERIAMELGKEMSARNLERTYKRIERQMLEKKRSRCFDLNLSLSSSNQTNNLPSIEGLSLPEALSLKSYFSFNDKDDK